MNQLLLLAGIFVLFTNHPAFSQQIERCATPRYELWRAENDPSYFERRTTVAEQIENHARQSSSRFSGETYRIPVVVHIIYNGEEQNVSDEKVFEQIEILNQDYRRLNSDASETRNEFLPVAADAGIEFYLADFDPDGNATSGITRTQTDVGSFWLSLTNMKSSSTGGADAWDVNHYLNIWVCNMAIPIVNLPLVLGFATPPEGAPNWPSGSSAEEPDQDGVVIHYGVFGSVENASGALAAVNRGRTATHEVGHYLGLRHIWGDGDCSADDGLSDTPFAADASQQTCDYNSNTCTDSPQDFPDMIENYMDYSDENCMNMFTAQQVEAMRFVIENFRQDLLLSSKSKAQKNDLSRIYPNPAHEFIRLELPDFGKQSYKYMFRDISGRTSKRGWLDSLELQVSDLTPGSYFLFIEGESNYFVHKVVLH
jgi:hypothetical protein